MYKMIQDNIFEVICDGYPVRPGDKIVLKDTETVIEILHKIFPDQIISTEFYLELNKMQGLQFTFQKAAKFANHNSDDYNYILYFEEDYNKVEGKPLHYWALTNEMFTPCIIDNNIIPDLFGNMSYGEIPC